MTALPQPKHLRFTVDEYYQMYEMGILKYHERAEIIDGELIPKMGIGDRHAAIVNFLTRFFIRNVSDEILVSVRNPVRLTDYHEPEPDFALADLTQYDGKRHPRPGEVLLIVEVSDSSLTYDRNVKLPLYAEAAIPEIWIVNLQRDFVEVYTNPLEGDYRLSRIIRRGDVLESVNVPTLQIEVDKILG